MLRPLADRNNVPVGGQCLVPDLTPMPRPDPLRTSATSNEERRLKMLRCANANVRIAATKPITGPIISDSTATLVPLHPYAPPYTTSSDVVNLALIAQNRTTETNADRAAANLRDRPNGAKAKMAAAINEAPMMSSAKLPNASFTLNPKNNSIANALAMMPSENAANLMGRSCLRERFMAAVCRKLVKSPMSASHPLQTIVTSALAVTPPSPLSRIEFGAGCFDAVDVLFGP